MERVDPPFSRVERDALRDWLNYQRESCLAKLDGLTEAQARWTPAPKANSLLGIVTHLVSAEQWWFLGVFAGGKMDFPRWGDPDDRDYEFKPSAEMTIETVRAMYRAEIERADAIERSAGSLDDVAANADIRADLRWIMIHMIEETARHAGHMDITREMIDGSTGL